MKTTTVLCDRLIYTALLGLVFVLPFSFALISSFQGMIAVLWLVKQIASESGARSHCLDNSMMWPLAALALLIVLTLPLSHDPSLSLKKFFSRFLFQALLMVVAADAVSTRRRLYGLLAALLAAMFLASLDALFQYARGYDFMNHHAMTYGRISGPMDGANDWGTMLVAVLPVAFVLPLIGHRRVWTGFLFLLFLCELGVTESRGAWVALVFGMVLLGFCVGRPKIMAAIAAMLLLFFWVFGIYCLSERVDIYNFSLPHPPAIRLSWSNPWGIPEEYNPWKLLSNLSGRNAYWGMAQDVVKKYPWFGCGYSTYTKTLNDLHWKHTEYPHNSLLHIASELGLVGLALYFWLFGALCMQSWKVLCAIRGDRALYLVGCGLACGILAWIIHSLADTPWSSLQLSLLVWLLIGLLMSLPSVSARKGT